MRKAFAIFCACICLFVPCLTLAQSAAPEEGELLYNGDFALSAESAALPSGWAFDAYISEGTVVEMGSDDAYGAFVAIDSADNNDARVYQDVPAEPDCVYLLSGMVRVTNVSGGTGASLSIDNYKLDGTYCYSVNLHNSADWQPVEMYVRSGPEQTVLRAAIRLGGYGTMAAGRAEFAALSLVKALPPEGAGVIDLASSNGTISNLDGESETILPATAKGVFTQILLFALAWVAVYAFVYMRAVRSGCGALTLGERQPKRILIGILAAAFLARLALSLIYYGHSTDINCFMAWGNAVLTGGVSNFYTSGMFADYPPGYMYICGALAWLCKLLGLPYGSDAMAFVFKLPATAADLVTAYLVYRAAKKRGCTEPMSLLLTALIAFNPALMFISGAWGQIDTLLTLLLVLACGQFIGGKRILAGAIYGLAILFKPQALMLGPVLAAAYVMTCAGPEWKRALRDAALAVLAALLVLFAGSLPFQGTQTTGLWLVEKYVSTAGGYPYASVEAFNLFALFGGNWAPVDGPFLGLTYRIWGTVGIAASVVFAIICYVFGRKRNAGALYLSGAVLIAGVFTLGHFMHERYLVPALLLLLMAYIAYRDRRLLLAFFAMTAPAFINVRAAMYIVDHQNARIGMYRALTACGSALSVLAFALLCWCAVSILIRGKTLSDVPVPKRAQKPLSVTVLPALPKGPTDAKLRYSKRDVAYVLAVTLVYGVVTLLNLGSLKAPQTFWQSTQPGETIVVDFGQDTFVASYAVFGNINNNGTLLVAADSYEETYEQTYDDMFRWVRMDAGFVARRVELMAYSGTLKLNEFAFYDETGAVIPVALAGATENERKLFDEQDAVPDRPSYFTGMYFDELYHGRTAYEHLHNLSPYENSHPPLGKLIIMVGIAIFGMCPFGWRVMGALFGVGMLPILYAFGKRMFKSSEYALLVTVLFAFDFMHFTQTRIATIDVYAVFFILLMYYYMYQYIQMNFFTDGLKRTYRPLFLAGLFFGIGTACKWTCIYAGGGLAVLLLLSLIDRYREYAQFSAHGTERERALVAPFWKNTVRTLLVCCVFYIAIPGLIYFASYAPYFIYESGQSAGTYGVSGMVKTFLKYQEFMYSYHSNLEATHPYQSAWYQWPFTNKPMWYYFNSYSDGQFVSTLTASGNPAVWWVSSVGAVVLLVERLLGRVKRSRALQVICVGILANYLPWVLVTRCTFIYHFFATVPFILLATVYLLQWAEEREPAYRYVKWVWIGLALLFFILLYPGLSGLPASNEWAAVLHDLPGGKLMYGAG